ncbi:MAG TPA: helix-turn-helix transcriptional regulator [Puia sp.]|uniref:helix-turn-helix domain-containing protein n=1 Tax=Puia sp. TaxID=2045100 RepID=UPI002CA3AFC1|nr:helix-turn-helix transcriptional regulator [Puia sp.]HVU97079.1 helix-turn-helix transcriptional regulator [Puia sp.]
MEPIPIRRIAPTSKQPSTPGRISVRDLSVVINGKELKHQLHKHDFYFILGIEHGTGDHEIDFNNYKIEGNALFILRPGQVHQLQLSADSKGYILEFDSSFYQPESTNAEHRWRKATRKNHCRADNPGTKKLLSILSHILHEYNEKRGGYLDAIKAHLDLFFIEYLRQSKNEGPRPDAASDYTQDRYEDFCRLLEVNIKEIKNVSRYASMLNLSTYQLNAITKSSVGKTASDLINEQIVLEAKRYLLATPNQIKEIAWDLGFEDPSYFIRFFKKHTGDSPDSFRKRAK